MALDLSDIHVSLAKQIKTYMARDWNVAAFPYSGMELPLIEVWPDAPYVVYFDTEGASTFGASGYGDVNLRLRIQIATGDAETALKQMAAVLSVGSSFTSSVPDAVMSNRTIGGKVADMIVKTAEWNPDDGDLGSVAWIPVRVIAQKSGAKV